MKVCTVCRRSKPLAEFGSNGNGYPKSYCKTCDNTKRCERLKRQGLWSGPAANERSRSRYAKRAGYLSLYQKIRRANPKHRARYIVTDCRRSDKKRGRSNDMTIAFVQMLIRQGCTYCGRDDLMMTLDRIDNSVGHITSNVVASCVRCNYIRRDMPYEAWLVITGGIKKASDQGLFGDWASGPRRNTNGA